MSFICSVSSTQRTTDEILSTVTALLSNSSGGYFLTQLTVRLNATRPLCHELYNMNDSKTLQRICHACWHGYSGAIITSLAVLWSSAGNAIQMQHSTGDSISECKQIAALLTQYENLLSVNEQTGLIPTNTNRPNKKCIKIYPLTFY
jgi:hypothetical protein